MECLNHAPKLNWLLTHVLLVHKYTHMLMHMHTYRHMYTQLLIRPVSYMLCAMESSCHRSQQPAELLLPFLERVLHLPLSPFSPPFSAVGQTLEFLGHSCRAVVGQSVLLVVGKVVRGEGRHREGWSRRVELLLRLAPLCEGLFSFISQDCLQLGGGCLRSCL